MKVMICGYCDVAGYSNTRTKRNLTVVAALVNPMPILSDRGHAVSSTWKHDCVLISPDQVRAVQGRICIRKMRVVFATRFSAADSQQTGCLTLQTRDRK